MTTPHISHLLFEIKTCNTAPGTPIKGAFNISQGDNIQIAVRIWNHGLNLNLAVAHVYSKLLQLISPDHSLEPLDATYTLPNANYGEKFENLYQFKQFVRMNEMGLYSDNLGNVYFCHKYLTQCSWVNNYYDNHPIGFGSVILRGHINADAYASMPETKRIDVNSLMTEGKAPLINSSILDQCFLGNILPKYFDYSSEQTTKNA